VKHNRLFVTMLCAALAAALPALAGEASAAGKDKAEAQVQSATAKSTEILTGLLDRVPEQAQGAIMKALDATQRGQEAALAALAGRGNPGAPETAPAAPPEGAGKPDVTGLLRAREEVAAGFQHSVAALNEALTQVPTQAQGCIQGALARIQDQQSAVLAKLDRLIAGERPEHPATAERPARPDRPARPERPETPERPEIPERPQPPQVPDRPETPAHAG
jgi:hypothetical protein